MNPVTCPVCETPFFTALDGWHDFTCPDEDCGEEFVAFAGIEPGDDAEEGESFSATS